ncbi:MAG: hypothetical protein FIA95_08405 [Gemmatimonadetes bacterium]|nr:hypothetical protein [Gemmatimonadota bacterium]
MKAAAALIALFVPLAAQAQDTTAVAAGQDTAAAAAAVPPALAEVESARSRACVATLNRIEELDSVLQPYAVRMERLRALGRAVSLEDRAEAGTFAEADTVEAAVARWFAADSVLAARYITEKVESIQIERTEARTAILDMIRAVMQAVNTEAQAKIGDSAALDAAARPCEGAILVRPAVLEACAGSGSRLCRAAADTVPQGAYRFVNDAADLWDVEDYRPWTTPEPLQATQGGGLAGARSAAQARRGNVVLGVALAPLLRTREELDSAQIAQLETNLDSLGYVFDHPLFVMAPVIEMQAEVPAPLGGETHVLLHFGALSGDDVIWSGEVGAGGLMQASVLASRGQLERLQAGELVSLTAVRIPAGEDQTAVPVYTVPLLQVGQAQSVTALLQYMGGGALSRDLMALVPPPTPGAF